MKKNSVLYIITLVLLIGGLAFGFGPVAQKTSGEYISFYQSLNYLNLGRYTPANIVTTIFLACSVAVVLVCFILTLVKPEMASGLKCFALITFALVAMCGGAMMGCSYIFFRYYGPVGAGIEGSYATTGYTGWAVIVSSVISILGGLFMIPLAIGSLPKKEEKPY